MVTVQKQTMKYKFMKINNIPTDNRVTTNNNGEIMDR